MSWIIECIPLYFTTLREEPVTQCLRDQLHDSPEFFQLFSHVPQLGHKKKYLFLSLSLFIVLRQEHSIDFNGLNWTLAVLPTIFNFFFFYILNIFFYLPQRVFIVYSFVSLFAYFSFVYFFSRNCQLKSARLELFCLIFFYFLVHKTFFLFFFYDCDCWKRRKIKIKNWVLIENVQAIGVRILKGVLDSCCRCVRSSSSSWVNVATWDVVPCFSTWHFYLEDKWWHFGRSVYIFAE